MTTTASTTALLRVINERAALEQIRQHGPVSRPELAKLTGLSKPTISLALADLERVGLVRTVGHRTGGAGRSAMLYEIRPEAGWVVGIDIGREWVRAALTDITGAVHVRQDVRSKARSAGALIDQIELLVRELEAEAKGPLTHIVIATPGVHDREQERLQLAPNIPGWQKPGVTGRLARRLPCDFTIENDVSLAVLGEQAYGLGAGLRNFIFVSIGTGLGMGVVINGSLYRGSRGAAGEIGFLPLGAGPTEGQLESVLSGPGLVAAAQRAGMKGRLTPEQIYDAARKGDPIAARLIGDEAGHISRALASAIAILDPELIVLGGGLGRTGADLLLEAVRDRLETMTPLTPPPVELSALESDAPVMGAVATGLSKAREILFTQAVAEPVGSMK